MSLDQVDLAPDGAARGGAATADVAGDPWDDLVAVALLGTDRRSLPSPGIDGPLAAALHSLPPGDLLSAAAVVWHYRSVGARAALSDEALPPSAPLDTRPLVSAGAALALVRLLENPRLRPILPEWMTLAEEAGLRLPPELVPAVFEVSRTPAAARLAGPLGLWLAERNPAWAWVTPVLGNQAAEPAWNDLERSWLVGAEAERPEVLAAMRSIHADRARALLEESWEEAPASLRHLLLEAMKPDLGPSDEALLERALDDSRKATHAAAAELLRLLPESALSSRLCTQALSCVSLEGRILPKLSIRPIVQVDEAMLRGEIQRPSEKSLDSDPYAVLGQILALVPLSAWTERLGRSASELVKMARQAGELKMLAAWAAATWTQGDAVWARALLAEGYSFELARVLPDAESDPIWCAQLKENPVAAAVRLVDWPRSWTPVLSAAWVDALAGIVKQGHPPGAGELREVLVRAATRIDVKVAQRATQVLGEALEHPQVPSGNAAQKVAQARAIHAFWANGVSRFLSIVSFRQAMQEEFR